MNDELTQQFADGVNSYWSGEVPDYWDHPETRNRSPFLQGWYMASMWETQPGWLFDMDGDPLQDEGDW